MKVICVDGGGVARLVASSMRCQSLIAAATPPEDVSPHIPVAPARGPAISEVPREVVMTESGPRVVRSAPVGFNRIRLGDAFDIMEEQARRAHPQKVEAARRKHPDVILVARAKHELVAAELLAQGQKVRGFREPVFDPPAFVPPFSPGQVEAGRDYARLVERVEASGLKCSSLETVGGGGGGLTVSEAVGRDMQRLAALRRRVGDGIAKDSVRPSKGGMRSAIRVMTLVDDVCCGGRTLAQVLERHGWGRNQRVKEVLRAHLSNALDRMRGYGLVVPNKAS